MSFTRPANTAKELARSRLVTPGRIAFATITFGLLATCATLLSQRATPTQPVETTLTLATSQNDLPFSPAPPSAGVDLRKLTAEAADRQLAAATEQLAQFESSVHGQLTELKSRLNDTNQAAMAQQAIAASATACYRAAARLEHDRQVTQILEAAQIDPLAWSRVPTDELVPYAELHQRLTELRTAQTRTAHLLKTRLPAHPAVRSALAAEQELTESLQQELAEVMPLRHAALKADEQQLTSLRNELQRQEAHEQQLVALAAEYDRYLGHVRTCEAVLRQAKQTVMATPDTGETPIAAVIEIGDMGSRPASAHRPTVTSHVPASQPATSSTLVSGNRGLLLLGGLFGGLFACMGYFYLTGSRSVVPNIARASSTGAPHRRSTPLWIPRPRQRTPVHPKRPPPRPRRRRSTSPVAPQYPPSTLVPRLPRQ